MRKKKSDFASRWLIFAQFALWLAFNPTEAVSRQFNDVNWAVNFAGKLDRLNPDEAFYEDNRMRDFPKLLIPSQERPDRVCVSTKCGVISEIWIVRPYACYFGREFRSVNEVVNRTKFKSPIGIFTTLKADPGFRNLGMTQDRPLQKLPARCIQSHNTLQYGVRRELVQNLNDFYSWLKAPSFGLLDTRDSDDFVSAGRNLACRASCVAFVGNSSAISPHIGDGIFDDKNDTGSVVYLGKTLTNTEKDGPKYFRWTYDRMLSTGVYLGGDGVAWHVYGNDVDISWDSKTWYHLLGVRCVRKLRSVSTTIPNEGTANCTKHRR